MVASLQEQDVMKLLEQVHDPEVPVLTISDLGVLREVKLTDGIYEITITPTYSGCPAMQTITSDIHAVMHAAGISNYKIHTVIAPPWTTDWISESGKQKLKEYGIAPPAETASEHLKRMMDGGKKSVTCPFCNSANTKLTSRFGSTACKALHYCNNCCQPFEEFKCH